MRVRWFGQSAFQLQGEDGSVVIDPFGDMSALAGRDLQFDYPPIAGVEARLVLVTHEHADHNAVEVVGGAPEVLRSTAGRLHSPVGEVLAVASEHDETAGIERGPNTIFVFDFGGMRVCHFGDFGQRGLRAEQAGAIGKVDLLFVPVGAGPTIGAEQAALVADELGARWIVPMHYRTSRISFLEPADEFLARYERVLLAPGPEFDTRELPRDEQPLVVVPAAP